MKIDTTVTIPQLSQLSAERAEVAGPGPTFNDVFSLASAGPHERCENFPTPERVSEQHRTTESMSDSAIDPAAETDPKPAAPTPVSKNPQPGQDACQTNAVDAGTTYDKRLDRRQEPVETSRKPADELAPENVVTPIQVAVQPVAVEQPKLRPEECSATAPTSANIHERVPLTAALPEPSTQAVASDSTPPAVSASSTQLSPSNTPQTPGTVVKVADEAQTDAATKTEPALADKSLIQDNGLQADSGTDAKPVDTTTVVSAGSNPSTVPIQANPQPDPNSVQPEEAIKTANELPSGEVTPVKGTLDNALQSELAKVESRSNSTTDSISQPMDQTPVDSRPSVFAIARDGVRAGLNAFRQFRNELRSSTNVAFQSTGGMQKLTSLLHDSIPELTATESAPASSFADKSETFTKLAGLEFGAPQHTQVQESIPQTSSGPLEQTTAPVPMESFVHRMTEIVQQRLEEAPEADKSSVVLRLDPPDLGRLNVHLSISNDVISIRMVATDEAARQAIERQLGNLHQSLDSQGVAFTPCQVECQSQGQNSSNQAPFQQRPDDVASVPFGQPRNPLTAPGVQSYKRSRSALDYVA